MRIAFEEDVRGLFTCAKPRYVVNEAPEQWSVERFQVHIGRFKVSFLQQYFYFWETIWLPKIVLKKIPHIGNLPVPPI